MQLKFLILLCTNGEDVSESRTLIIICRRFLFLKIQSVPFIIHLGRQLPMHLWIHICFNARQWVWRALYWQHFFNTHQRWQELPYVCFQSQEMRQFHIHFFQSFLGLFLSRFCIQKYRIIARWFGTYLQKHMSHS